MRTNLFNAKHWGRMGPGGWYCYCCGPAPKDRKKFVRIHKRRMTRILNKLEKEQ